MLSSLFFLFVMPFRSGCERSRTKSLAHRDFGAVCESKQKTKSPSQLLHHEVNNSSSEYVSMTYYIFSDSIFRISSDSSQNPFCHCVTLRLQTTPVRFWRDHRTLFFVCCRGFDQKKYQNAACAVNKGLAQLKRTASKRVARTTTHSKKRCFHFLIMYTSY